MKKLPLQDFSNDRDIVKEETLVTVSEVTLVKVENVVTVLKMKKEEKNLDKRTFFIKSLFSPIFSLSTFFYTNNFFTKKPN